MTDKPLVKSGQDLISDYWKSSKENKKEIVNPTEAFKRYCENDPSALECREYDI